MKEREREVDDGKRVKDYSGRMQCISRENVMLIISERREMEDKHYGVGLSIFSIEISMPRGQDSQPLRFGTGKNISR